MKRTHFKTRLLALVMSAICLLGLFPAEALAADAAPSSVTLAAATFAGNYSSPSFSGSVGLHQMTMRVGTETHDAFCAEHGKGMGTSLIGQPWSDPQPVSNSVIKLMMGYYYTHQEGIFNDACIAKGFNWTWDSEYGMHMNAWVQAVCWRALGQGAAIGDTTEAIATELMYVYNSLNNTSHTDIHNDLCPNTGTAYYDIASAVVENADAWCDVDVYQYRYAGGTVGDHTAANTQAMLVGIPGIAVQDQDYSIIVKKVDSSNPTKGLAGATFTCTKVGSTSVKTGTTGADGTYTFGGLDAGTYSIYETSAPSGYEIDNPGPYYVSLPGADGDTVTVTATDTPIRSASGSIRKVDKDNPTRGLAGASIKITGIDNNFSGTYQTNEAGALDGVPWDTMPIGAYAAEEVGAPSGYILDAQRQEFYWDGKTDVRLVFQDDAKVKLRLLKTDASGVPLPGAVYNILRDGQIIGTEATDAGGSITVSNITEGFYQFVEVSAPTGYVRSTEPVSAHVDAADIQAGGTVTVTAVNQAKPGLTIVKRDANSGAFVPGCTFLIEAIDSAYSQEATTDGTGRIYLEALDPGSYKVTETAVPEGYNLNTMPQTVELRAGENSQLVFTNVPKCTLTLYKHDSGGHPIAGATFTVAKKGGASLGEFTTDGTGLLTVPNLDPGIYTATETDCPTDYILDTTPHEFEVKAGETWVTVDVLNLKKPKITINKVDSIVGGPVEDAKFEVFYAGTGGTGAPAGTYESLGVKYTDGAGQIVLDHLKEGWYRFTELEPPAGYQMKEPSTQEIYLKGDDDKSLTFKNTPLSAIIVEKEDSVSGEPVAGVEFQLRYLAGTSGTGGTVIGQKTTGTSGVVSWTALKAGYYEITEIKAPDGYVASEKIQTVYLSGNDQDVVTVKFSNAPKGTLQVVKVCSLNAAKLLADAEFKVTYTDGTLIGENNGIFRTDANGQFTIPNLTPGKSVSVTEIQAPDGFVLDSTPQTIVIQSGKIVTLTFKNAPKGSLIIEKRDSETNELLPGAEFTVTTAAGCEVGQDGNIGCGGSGTISSNSHFVTGDDGKIVLTGLAPGNYIITETAPPAGYQVGDNPTRTITVTAGDTQTIVFKNAKDSGITIVKRDSVTKEPLAGAEFRVTDSTGAVVDNAGGAVSSNGVYVTDAAGQVTLTGLNADTYIITETKAPSGYLMDAPSQTVKVGKNDHQTLTFYDTPIGGLIITKVDADTGKRLEGAQVEVRKMNGAVIGSYYTDQNGNIRLPGLDSGWYVVVELKAPKGYLLDATPQQVEVKDGKTATLEVKNSKAASALIHKIDSSTGKGLQGARFVLYDSSMTPLGEYESDNSGYVHLNKTLEDGKYYVREIVAPDGYILDNTVKSFHVTAGDTAMIEWKNTSALGQIQIVKTSADYNTINGLAAGTRLSGATYAIYNKANTVVDTITTDSSGVASSKKLPLGSYTVREISPAANYNVDPNTYTANIEFAGQIVRLELTNASVSTGLAIQKTGYTQVMPKQPIRYTVTGVANTSNVSLQSFYWRDTLPTEAMRLTRLTTGTYSVTQNYKVVYTTNTSGGAWKTAYDNLSTAKNYTLDMSSSALGLAANEYVTQVMLSFGVVPAGFHQVGAAYLNGTVLSGVKNGKQFTNKADVGGIYGGKWLQSMARWTTGVWSPVTEKLPRTGF